ETDCIGRRWGGCGGFGAGLGPVGGRHPSRDHCRTSRAWHAAAAHHRCAVFSHRAGQHPVGRGEGADE
ncbi:MAG: hypothetical protein ACK559_14600, partial [bacterium]